MDTQLMAARLGRIVWQAAAAEYTEQGQIKTAAIRITIIHLAAAMQMLIVCGAAAAGQP